MKHKALDQQVIVITGASSGIGLCTALLAAERGSEEVQLAGGATLLGEVVKAIIGGGGNAPAVMSAVSDRESVARAADEILSSHASIDTWVNSGAVAIYARLDEVSDDDSRRLLD